MSDRIPQAGPEAGPHPGPGASWLHRPIPFRAIARGVLRALAWPLGTTRRLIATVALIALLIGGSQMARRRAEYSRQARQYAGLERESRAQEGMLTVKIRDGYADELAARAAEVRRWGDDYAARGQPGPARRYHDQADEVEAYRRALPRRPAELAARTAYYAALRRLYEAAAAAPWRRPPRPPAPPAQSPLPPYWGL